MALFDNVWINAVLSIALFGILVYFMQKYRTKHAQSREVAKAGSTIKQAAAGFDELKRKERKERAGEEAIEKTITSTGGKSERKIGRTTETEAEAESQTEEATTKLEETTTAIVATLDNTTNEILATVEEKIKTEEVEEKEVAIIESLQKRLNFLNKLDKIDEATAKYLHDYFNTLAEKTKQDLEYEQTSEAHHRTFIKHIRQALSDLKIISTEARRNLNTVSSKEKREKRSFNKELRTIKWVIIRKQWRLRMEKFKGRKADASLIAQLQKEIILLEKNQAELAKLTQQLNATHEMLDLEIKKLKEMMKQVIAIAKSQQRFSRTLNKRDRTLKNRLKDLKKYQDALEKGVEQFSNTQTEKIHGLILGFSEHLSNYFTFYIELLKDDTTFEEKLKEIITQNYLLEQKMLAFVKLLASLDETEEAVDQGTEAMTSIVSTIMTQNVAVSLQQQRKILVQTILELDYKKKVEQTMAALTQEQEQKTMLASQKIDELLKKEKHIIEENQALHKQESQHLANSMGTMVNRKIALDQNYFQQAVKFGDQLEQRNEIAGAAYQEALKKAA